MSQWFDYVEKQPLFFPQVCSSASPSPASSHGGDQLLRGLSENGQVSILVCNATQLVDEAVKRHQTAPTASAALGRTLVGGLLMGE